MTLIRKLTIRIHSESYIKISRPLIPIRIFALTELGKCGICIYFKSQHKY